MSDLLVDKQGGITIVTINRPERRNALSGGMFQMLADTVAEFSDDDAQKVLIVTGAGDQAFSAGADLKAMRTGDEPARGGRRMVPMAREPDIAGIAACEKPTIAAINGLAVGGGLEIAISCDIRVASENAWFGLPEPGRGFIAGLAVSVLPRLLPIGAVMDIMLAGERLQAADAYRLGLVQALTTPQGLMAEALRRAEAMCKMSQPALWGTKKAIKFWRDIMIEEQHRHYQAVAHRVLLSGDMVEGLQAFAEKRDPQFSTGWPDPMAKLDSSN
ncbi:MAG TPA: enoyl-CoA hydratase/isomerase family protein [Sphingobium sp.]|nr:enoyl-CoA hydratase/isomerase family protein [Sphingobium sp.]